MSSVAAGHEKDDRNISLSDRCVREFSASRTTRGLFHIRSWNEGISLVLFFIWLVLFFCCSMKKEFHWRSSWVVLRLEMIWKKMNMYRGIWSIDYSSLIGICHHGINNHLKSGFITQVRIKVELCSCDIFIVLRVKWWFYRCIDLVLLIFCFRCLHQPLYYICTRYTSLVHHCPGARRSGWRRRLLPQWYRSTERIRKSIFSQIPHWLEHLYFSIIWSTLSGEKKARKTHRAKKWKDEVSMRNCKDPFHNTTENCHPLFLLSTNEQHRDQWHRTPTISIRTEEKSVKRRNHPASITDPTGIALISRDLNRLRRFRISTI